MQRLTKVGVLSFGKFMGALPLALMGLIFGVIYGAMMILLGVVGAASGQEGGGAIGHEMGIGMGLAMMIGIPLFYGAFGFIFRVDLRPRRQLRAQLHRRPGSRIQIRRKEKGESPHDAPPFPPSRRPPLGGRLLANAKRDE